MSTRFYLMDSKHAPWLLACEKLLYSRTLGFCGTTNSRDHKKNDDLRIIMSSHKGIHSNSFLRVVKIQLS